MHSDFHIDEGVLTHLGDISFSAVRLRAFAAGWAVVGQPSGAVAVDDSGELVMHLHRAAALRMARERTMDMQRSGFGSARGKM